MRGATTRITSADGRIVLERIGLDRGHALLDGDPAALVTWVAAPGWPTSDTADGLRLTLEHASSDEDTGFLVIDSATSSVIGDCGWKGRPDRDGAVEIGYGLAASVRGRGLGTTMVRTLAEWTIEQPGCRCVTAEVMVHNTPSRRALERVGFALDRLEGRTVWYSLGKPGVRAEWREATRRLPPGS